jgi:hypothetical protein
LLVSNASVRELYEGNSGREDGKRGGAAPLALRRSTPAPVRPFLGALDVPTPVLQIAARRAKRKNAPQSQIPLSFHIMLLYPGVPLSFLMHAREQHRHSEKRERADEKEWKQRRRECEPRETRSDGALSSLRPYVRPARTASKLWRYRRMTVAGCLARRLARKGRPRRVEG